MSNVHRKHPLSVAISMVLLAAAATSARASELTAAPAENAGAQDAAPQNGPTTPSPDAKKAKTGNGSDRSDEELQELTVTGVRESQIRAIEVKRLAPSIQDSISAESIGQLPDVTITDALQRITGVQNQPGRGRWKLGGRARPASGRHHAER